MRLQTKLLFILSGLLMLNGCITAAITTKRVIDHPASFEELATDTYLEFLAVKQLRLDKILGKRWITVDVNDKIAVVNGTVPTEEERNRVDEVVGQVQKLSEIINNVKVSKVKKPPECDDILMANRVRMALIGDWTVKSLPIEVYSNRCRIYLTGMVSSKKEEARIIRLAEDQKPWGKVNSFIVIKEGKK